MKNFNIYLSLITLLLLSTLTAQNKKITITGKVIENNLSPVQFANVFLLNTFDGAMSGEDGGFTFTTAQKGEQTLIASMIGYKKFSQTIYLDTLKSNSLIIRLESNIVSTPDVVITASSFSSEKGKGVVMTDIDVLTTPGGAADIFQAIKTMPGLTQVSESAELYVRGGDPLETITLIDQASLNHPYTYESSYGGLFSNINSSNIKGMYFSSGGFSCKYGNALSGVLDLQTKDEPNVKSITLGISMASIEFDAENNIIPDKLGVRINGRKSYTAPIFWFNGGKKDFELAPQSQDISGSISYKFSSTGRIKSFLAYSDDKQGVKVNQPGYIDIFNGKSNNILGNLQVSEFLSNNLFSKNSFSFSKFSSTWKLGILDLKRDDFTFKFRTDNEYTWGNNKFLFGYEVERREFQYLGIIPKEDYDFRNDAESEILNAKYNNTRHGAYIENEFSDFFGIDNLHLIGGLRFDYIPALNISWLDPRLNLSYKISNESTISAGWGFFHQSPDSRLYAESDGNPNLKAMKAQHFIVSFNYQLNKNDNIRLEAFYKKYYNLPLEDSIINYSNNGFGYAKGIDLIIKGKFLGIFDGWISYGLIDTKRKWMDFEELTSSSYDITHNFTLVTKYNLTNYIQLGINYKFATGKPYTPIAGGKPNTSLTAYEPIYNLDNSKRYPNYNRLDFRVSYLTTLFDIVFSAFYVEAINILDIKNIFDYSYSYDYSQKKEVTSYFGSRTIVIGVQMKL